MRRWSTSTASAGRALALVSVMTTAAACNTPHRLSTLRAPLVFHAPARVTVGAGALLSASSPQLRAAALHYPRKIAPAAPISLTASDGTGLELVEIDARAVLEGPLAFTELRLSFRNPQRRRLEGRFSITLPDGAAISRFAMRIGRKWQEAEVVERQAARAAYESFLHRRRDPALFEKKAGNAFRARVFPIAPRAVKQLIISYSEELADTRRPYRIHLKGLPRIKRLRVMAMVGRARRGRPPGAIGGALTSRQVVRVSRRDWKPDQDFLLNVPASLAGLGNGDLVVARVAPAVPDRPDPLQSLLVLVDTSASRAAGFAAQVETLGALVKQLAARADGRLRLKVACYDQAVAAIYEGTAGGFGADALRRILARRALGASNLHGALRWAARVAGHRRLLLITDGVQTAGPTGGRVLRRAVARLKRRFERIDVVLVGGIRDERLMQRLTSDNGLAREGAVLEGTLGPTALARGLTRRAISNIEVHVLGARWVWPTVIHGAQPGSQRLIYASVPRAARAGAAVTVRLSGPLSQTARVPIAAVERPLLERASVQARIQRLIHRRDTLGRGDAASARAVRQKIVALSTRHRVLSDYTALLVLESEWDYRRFNIDRRSLSDILTVDARGVVSRRRTWDDVAASVGAFGGQAALGTDTEDALGGLIGDPMGRTYGLGGLGVASRRGVAGRARGARRAANGKPGRPVGWAGRSEPRGQRARPPRSRRGRLGRRPPRQRGRTAKRRGRRARASKVHVGRPTVRGTLDPEIVRRVVRQRLDEVRSCYQRELLVYPRLAGVVVLRFTIAPTGHVLTAGIKGSTLGNRAVDRCVARAARRWRFPRPAGGGMVAVSYRILFRTRAGGGPATASAPQGPGDRLVAVQGMLHRGAAEQGLVEALRWRAAAPGDVLALVALGESLAATGRTELAARAYGSIIDLYPSRADMRRFAGQRLEALGGALDLAADSYSVAVRLRPDHPVGHRLLAYALLRRRQPARAFAVLRAGLRSDFPSGRFRGIRRVLREDLGLVAAAWIRTRPALAPRIRRRLTRLQGRLPAGPSLRFVLHWETDANDVDLHVRDAAGDHAFHRHPRLSSGGRLYDDVTTGYGPECFAVSRAPRAYPYRLSVHYYRRGPMGYGMGTVQVIRHDGKGGLRFAHRPFVVAHDDQEVRLRPVRR